MSNSAHKGLETDTMKRIILVAAGIGIAVALATAQDAHADEASFLRALDNDSLTVGTPALTLGHQVCMDIIGNGTTGVEREAQQGLDAGLSSHDVAYFIVDAVYELCPSAIPAVRAWITKVGA